jgi:ubiquinone/menaquinone biosynthesis C-methylase UbiE
LIAGGVEGERAMTDNPEDRKAQTALQFSRLAADYDYAGCFTHFGRRLVEAVGVEPGQRVLDVASGRGAVLFPAAERAGPNGHVEGIDLAEGMVSAVNADAERRGIAARVRVMDAEHLDFSDASFDHVLCGFGIMFPPDQVRALSEMRRVLRPGGQIGLSTWREAESQDLSVVLNDIGQATSQPPGWITEPDILSELLTRAGFSAIQVVADTPLFHHADLDAYWQGAMGTGARRSIEAMDADQTMRVRAALAERLTRYRQVGGYHVPATALIATASR